METLKWSALEHEERDRSNGWFWALGIIVFTASSASIIYNNYFFAALVILSGILFVFLAIKKPDLVSYQLNENGFLVNTDLYPYENIKSFWVQVEPKPILFIKSERIFIPIISVPIDHNIGEVIRDIMLEKQVLEEEMKEHVSEKIMNTLGF